MPKKVLIVGGAGYVLGHTTDILEEYSEYEVTVYDNLTFEDRYLKDVNFVFGDIRDKEKLKPLLDKSDIVILGAACVGDSACSIDPVFTEEINFKCAKWITDNFTGHLVFLSTASVYGKNNDYLNEYSPTNPLSVYAKTKLQAEQYIVDNHPDHLIFRLGTLYGLGDRFSRIRCDLVVNILTIKAVLGDTLKITGQEQWRPLLHVKDVTSAIQHCFYNDIKGLYCLSSGNYTIKQIGDKILENIRGAKIEYHDLPFEDQRNYKVANDKILATNWKPVHTIDEGIQEIATLIREKRIKNPYNPIYSNGQFFKLNHIRA